MLSIVQIVLCTYMVVAMVHTLVTSNMSLLCNDFDANNVALASLVWIFYLSKVWDMLDTGACA